jgi:hypothetical protein
MPQLEDYRIMLIYTQDIDIVKVNLDSTHFPGVPSTVLVHQGFADAQLK